MKTAIISSIVNRQFLIAIFLFFIFYLLFFIFLPPARAADQSASSLPANEAIDKINEAAITGDFFDDKIFNLNQMAGTVDSLQVLLTGKSQLHPQTNALLMGSGAIAASGNLVATLYGAPPASGIQYFAGVIQKFNPVQEAYAQEGGIGFSALSPVQKTWTAFRNISYVGFVIVFIVIGFMVMFRSKISPQAVATIQDSLPRIVVALILVTFSYAIVGLMIDVMFVFLNVIINILKNTGNPPLLTNEADVIFQKSVFGVVLGMWTGAFGAVFDAVGTMIQNVTGTGGLDKVLGFFGGGIAGIIAGIAILFIMFRVFFMLLMAYVTIILLTIFAPFLLLFQALPGNNGAKEWFRQVAANISVFPVVALMFILAGILGNIAALGGGNNPVDPAKVGQFPLLAGDIEGGAIIKLIGLGILFMTPGAAKMVKERFGVKEGAIGAGFAAGGAALGAGAGAFGRPFGAAINPVKQSLSYQYGHGMAERIGRFTGKTARTPGPTEEEIATSQQH